MIYITAAFEGLEHLETLVITEPLVIELSSYLTLIAATADGFAMLVRVRHVGKLRGQA